jgi:nitroreductase
MELSEALRTTGAVRDFRPEPVPDDVLYRVLDAARFGPSGGNKQGWHVVVVKDTGKRRALRDAYLPAGTERLTLTAGGRPWAPVNDRAAEEAVLALPGGRRAKGFEHLDEVPVLLAVFVDPARPPPSIRDLTASLAGGASVYRLRNAIRPGARGPEASSPRCSRGADYQALADAPDATHWPR